MAVRDSEAAAAQALRALAHPAWTPAVVATAAAMAADDAASACARGFLEQVRGFPDMPTRLTDKRCHPLPLTVSSVMAMMCSEPGINLKISYLRLLKQHSFLFQPASHRVHSYGNVIT